MTITEQAALVGKERLLRISTPDGKETIHVPVVVKDTRNAFGRVMLVVEPVNGEGQMTVNLDRTKERTKDLGLPCIEADVLPPYDPNKEGGAA